MGLCCMYIYESSRSLSPTPEIAVIGQPHLQPAALGKTFRVVRPAAEPGMEPRQTRARTFPLPAAAQRLTAGPHLLTRGLGVLYAAASTNSAPRDTTTSVWTGSTSPCAVAQIHVYLGCDWEITRRVENPCLTLSF